jgi:hypothetical protein
VLKLKKRQKEPLFLAFLPKPFSLRLLNIALLLTLNYLRLSYSTTAFKLNSALSVINKDIPNLYTRDKKSVSNTQSFI